MRGTLREKRPGYRELRIRVWRDPLTGQQRQVSPAVRGSRREAEKALAAFYAEVDAPAAPASKGAVGELLEAWLDQVADELSPKTVHEYRRLIQVRIWVTGRSSVSMPARWTSSTEPSSGRPV